MCHMIREREEQLSRTLPYLVATLFSSIDVRLFIWNGL